MFRRVLVVFVFILYFCAFVFIILVNERKPVKLVPDKLSACGDNSYSLASSDYAIANYIKFATGTVCGNTYDTCIILQQSPVQPQLQSFRLSAIDDGWATWGGKCKVQVVAAAANNLLLGNLSISTVLKYIHTIFINSSQTPMSPYINMIETFTILSTSKYNHKWFVFANDHTFMILPNLARHLASLDYDLAIYTGSKLQRGNYKKEFLYFASGGAGAVLSHVSLKLLILSWVLTRNDIVVSTINRISETAKLTTSPPLKFDFNNGKKIMCVNQCSSNEASFMSVILFIHESYLQHSTYSKSTGEVRRPLTPESDAVRQKSLTPHILETEL